MFYETVEDDVNLRLSEKRIAFILGAGLLGFSVYITYRYSLQEFKVLYLHPLK